MNIELYSLYFFEFKTLSLNLLQVDLLASGASLFGREAADRERRSHVKSDEGLFESLHYHKRI